MDHLISRRYLSVLRILLGVIFLATWGSNLAQGFYTAAGFREFIEQLAAGHPIEPYRLFLLNVVAPGAEIVAPFQMIAELGMGVALLFGVLTRAAALGAAFFFFNLLLAYLNPELGEWIWTYVMLVTLAVLVALGAAGRAWGVDALLLRRFGEPRVPVY